MCYFDFPILRSRGQHFWIFTEAHAQYSIIHHHEVILQQQKNKYGIVHHHEVILQQKNKKNMASSIFMKLSYNNNKNIWFDMNVK